MENTTENNKLIAEFMEIKLFKNSKEFKQCHPKTFKKQAKETQYKTLYIMDEGKDCWFTMPLMGFRYHSSWDWLMPVVEKIESLGFNITIEKNHTDVMEIFNGLGSSLFGFKRSSDKIKNTHKAVVEFIKWWNNQVEIKKATK